MPVLVQGRHTQQIGTVFGDATRHGLVITIPVALALPHRDDQVHRLADRLCGRMAEDAFGRSVPECHEALGIADHDRVAGTGNELIQIQI